MILEDKDPMPFGKYKGIRMDEVPEAYLSFLLRKVYRGSKPMGADGAAVHNYIVRNWDRIKTFMENS